MQSVAGSVPHSAFWIASEGARPLNNRLLSIFTLALITAVRNARKAPAQGFEEKANTRHAQQPWRFVAAQAQSYLPLDWWKKPFVLSQPIDWFHEAFRQNDAPHWQRQVDLIGELTGRETHQAAFA
jgi:hypothetical protein